MDNKEKIRLYALQNAVRHGGTANPKAVMGQILQEVPELRKDAKTLFPTIDAIVKEVNALKPEQQKAELEKQAPELLEKKVKEKRDLFDFLKIPEGAKVRTAFPPEPSKYPHIGHAKAIIINHELARRKNGEFILRFEDTNPTLASKEFYDIHLDNYEWLGIKPDKVDYASDYMETFYKYAEKMISDGNAYICTCSHEEISAKRKKGLVCDCRSNAPKDNSASWGGLKDAEEGTAILRAKLDMEHKNSAMRDPAMMRIIDAPHTRTGTKYRLWPTYDFENSVMDGVEGITHRLRSKEFELRNELQRTIQKMLGFNETSIYEFARFNMTGVESSGRIIRDKIEKGELLGWDDPSLTTLVALRRRGFAPEAIKNFVLSTGITKSESTMTWDDLIIQNRRLLDKEANRYFFVANPVKITIEGAPEITSELKVHPEFPDRGVRKLKSGTEFLITKKDFDSLKEKKLYRLMDCLNFEKSKDGFKFISIDVADYKNKGEKIIHWLPVSELAEFNIHMPDNTIVKGKAEKTTENVGVGDIIQFEHFGFCRRDNKTDFWYSHK